jgi:ADP-ribose pyrophosphatase YjhB (NUDIX family)
MKGIVVTLIAGAMLLTSCQESLEDRCAREAKEFTEKNCPRAVDKEIVLDSMAFEKSTHTISYLYTLMGTLDDPQRIDSKHFRELLLMEVKNSTNLKLYKDAGYSFRYCYYSEKENGTKLFEATFRESDYQ